MPLLLPLLLPLPLPLLPLLLLLPLQRHLDLVLRVGAIRRVAVEAQHVLVRGHRAAAEQPHSVAVAGRGRGRRRQGIVRRRLAPHPAGRLARRLQLRRRPSGVVVGVVVGVGAELRECGGDLLVDRLGPRGRRRRLARQVVQVEREDVRLRREDVSAVLVDVVVGVEEEVEVLERLREEEGLHVVLGGAVAHVREADHAARHAQALQRAEHVSPRAEPLVAVGGAVRPEERLDVLGPQRVAALPGLDLHRREVEALGVEAEVAPQRVEGAQRVDGELALAEQQLHPRPEALQRVEERPRHLPVGHVRVDVPRAVLEVAQRRVVRVVEDGEVLGAAEEHVRLEHVLEERVDPAPDPRVGLRPLARAQVDVRAEQVELRAPRPDPEHGAPRRRLEARVAREPREQTELEEQRAGGGGARDGRLGRRDAAAQIDRAKRDARVGLQRRQQPPAQVEREREQPAARVVWRRHEAEPRIDRQQMRAEQPAKRADVRLEDGHSLVLVKVDVVDAPADEPLELGRVAHQRERVERVEHRQRYAAPRIGALAALRQQHVVREGVFHVGVPRVGEELTHLLAQLHALVIRHA